MDFLNQFFHICDIFCPFTPYKNFQIKACIYGHSIYLEYRANLLEMAHNFFDFLGHKQNCFLFMDFVKYKNRKHKENDLKVFKKFN